MRNVLLAIATICCVVLFFAWKAATEREDKVQRKLSDERARIELNCTFHAPEMNGYSSIRLDCLRGTVPSYK